MKALERLGNIRTQVGLTVKQFARKDYDTINKALTDIRVSFKLYIANKETAEQTLSEYYKDFAFSDTDEYGRQHSPIHIPIPLTKAPQAWQYIWLFDEILRNEREN